jgi:ADP-ribose pyrophosphatase
MRDVLLTTPKFSVERRTFARPGGRTVTHAVVVHPGAVVIVPILDDGRMVMIRNYRYALDQVLLELPAGTREPDEPAALTAMRELEEETGYRAAHMEPLLEFFTSPGVMTERMQAFLANGLTLSAQNLQGGEEITVELFAPEQVRQMLVDGTIQDGKSIAALGTYFLRRASAQVTRR